MNTTVSVIIPTFNCARFLAEAIRSARGQTYPPSQIIVIDDGSTDGTSELIAAEEWADVTYLRKERGGVAAARNAGVACATGDIVAFLDADDVWHPQKLETQISVLAKAPDFNLLGTMTFAWPGETPQDAQGTELSVQTVSWRELAVRNYFTTSSVIIRRQALETAGPGPFDTSLQGPEDYDLWLRIARQGRAAKVLAPLTGYRSVANSLGRQARGMQSGMVRILAKLDDQNAWNCAGGLLLRRQAHSYFHYSCAYMYGASGEQWTAVCEVLRSMLLYPVPFRPDQVRMFCARPRLAANAGLRMLGLKAPQTI